MPLEIRLLFGLALATLLVYAATPLAIRIAAHFDFYDKPRGYRGHAQPTPFLGGAAVVAGFVAVVLLLTRQPSQTLPIVAGILVLWAVGTIDDRRSSAAAAGRRRGRARGHAVGVWPRLVTRPG